MNLLFLGLPGCGVSETARCAAERLNLRFVDTDEVLTRNLSLSRQDLYSLFTPDALRDVLCRLASQLADGDGYCIAAGDCLLDEREALETLASSACTVLLDMSPEEAAAVCREPDHPVLRRGLFRLRELYDDRRDRLAAMADAVLSADGQTPEMLAEQMIPLFPQMTREREADVQMKQALEENRLALTPLLSARAALFGLTEEETDRYIASVLDPPKRDGNTGED